MVTDSPTLAGTRKFGVDFDNQRLPTRSTSRTRPEVQVSAKWCCRTVPGQTVAAALETHPSCLAISAWASRKATAYSVAVSSP